MTGELFLLVFKLYPVSKLLEPRLHHLWNWFNEQGSCTCPCLPLFACQNKSLNRLERWFATSTEVPQQVCSQNSASHNWPKLRTTNDTTERCGTAEHLYISYNHTICWCSSTFESLHLWSTVLNWSPQAHTNVQNFSNDVEPSSTGPRKIESCSIFFPTDQPNQWKEKETLVSLAASLPPESQQTKHCHLCIGRMRLMSSMVHSLSQAMEFWVGISVFVFRRPNISEKKYSISWCINKYQYLYIINVHCRNWLHRNHDEDPTVELHWHFRAVAVPLHPEQSYLPTHLQIPISTHCLLFLVSTCTNLEPLRVLLFFL